MKYLNDEFRDRGIKKWTGFYLSEHTAARKAEEKIKQKSNPQKEAVDSEGKYYDDVIGQLSGFDELGIYVGGEKIDCDEIRNVEMINVSKWSDI